jgi:hypothetical protein
MVFKIANVEKIEIGQWQHLGGGFSRCDLVQHYIELVQQDLDRLKHVWKTWLIKIY